MSKQRAVTFQKALDIVESLPECQQESLPKYPMNRLRKEKGEVLKGLFLYVTMV